MTKKAKRTRQLWKKKDDKYIRDHAGKMDMIDIAAELKRTLDATNKRASRLGIIIREGKGI